MKFSFFVGDPFLTGQTDFFISIDELLKKTAIGQTRGGQTGFLLGSGNDN